MDYFTVTKEIKFDVDYLACRLVDEYFEINIVNNDYEEEFGILTDTEKDNLKLAVFERALEMVRKEIKRK